MRHARVGVQNSRVGAPLSRIPGIVWLHGRLRYGTAGSRPGCIFMHHRASGEHPDLPRTGSSRPTAAHRARLPRGGSCQPGSSLAVGALRCSARPPRRRLSRARCAAGGPSCLPGRVRCRRRRCGTRSGRARSTAPFVALLMPAVGITGAVAPPLQAQALGTHPVCDLVFAWRRAVVPPDCGISAHRRTSSQARVSVPSRQPGGASRKLGPTGSEGSWRSFVTESNLILSRAHASTRRSVLEWSLRSGMLAQRRSGLICAKPVPSQIRPSAMPNRRCAAHLRSSALSGFLPVRPGSRAEGGAAIPGLDGQAAGLGACTL